MDRIALKTNEAAKLLGLSPSTLKRLAKTGQLPARKPGGMYLFSEAALRRWLEDGRLAEVTSAGSPAIPKPIKRVVNAAPSVIRRTRRRSRMAVDAAATPNEA